MRGFVGHFALSNRHVARAQASPQAQVTFLGPHGYISPGMVSASGWGPTWNYRFAQFEVELEFEPERGPEAIVELVTAMEGEGGDAWTVARMGERFEVLAKHVIAFRASVIGATTQFKLGQDEPRRLSPRSSMRSAMRRWAGRCGTNAMSRRPLPRPCRAASPRVPEDVVSIAHSGTITGGAVKFVRID